MPVVPVADWTGPPHQRPGLCLPRQHQLQANSKLDRIVESAAPGIVQSAHDAERETWPAGLRSTLGITRNSPDVELARGWTYRVLRAVGPVERSDPRRWVMTESVALRLRGPYALPWPPPHHGIGAVVVWTCPVVWLKHPRRHKPKPARWKVEYRKYWPLAEDGRPADTPRDVSATELTAMIGKG